MKKRLIALLLLLSVTVAVTCACNDEEKPPEIPTGGFGGLSPFGSAAVDFTDYSTVAASDFLAEGVINAALNTGATESATRYEIDLDALGEAKSDAYSYKNDELKISAGGIFVLSGTLSGCVSVADTDEAVTLVLNGVNIATTSAQNCAAIVFKKPSGDSAAARIITVCEGTINVLADSTGDDADGDGAVIQAKKRSLTINGGGELRLECKGDETSGIKVKKALVIDGVKLTVSSAAKNGIKADELIVIRNASLTVSAGNDGIKTDMEPESDDEARLYASESRYGYLYIENSDIDVSAGDDGISANNCIYIANSANNKIKIVTNGGAPQTVTEASSDSADGKGIKTDGVEYGDVLYEASYAVGYGLVITGGSFEINSNDDAISSKGSVLIVDGDFDIASGDDGIHAEYLTKILGGDITVRKSYEGIEGARVEILGGTLDVTALDDGINAANADLKDYFYYILVAGGNVAVNADGDGLDSNGTLKITGGVLNVCGPVTNDNSALDADSGIIINGGTVCAVGSSGMLEFPSDKSEQCYLGLRLNESQSANMTIIVKDGDGNELFRATPAKKYSSVIISLPALVDGESYSLIVGGETHTVTAGFQLSGTMGAPNGMERPDGMGGPNGTGKPDGMGDPNEAGKPDGKGDQKGNG